MILPLHAETVQVTQISCASRGYYTEYHAQFEHDGTRIFNRITFKEATAKAFREAGHTQVSYKRGHVIEMAHVDCVIEDVNNRYEIIAILASDGSVHTVEQPRRRVKRKKEEWNPETLAMLKKRYSDPSTSARIEKKKAAQDRFQQGQRLVRWQLSQNDYFIVVINDEWFVEKKQVAQAA